MGEYELKSAIKIPPSKRVVRINDNIGSLSYPGRVADKFNGLVIPGSSDNFTPDISFCTFAELSDIELIE